MVGLKAYPTSAHCPYQVVPSQQQCFPVKQLLHSTDTNPTPHTYGLLLSFLFLWLSALTLLPLQLCFLPEPSCWDAASPPATALQLLFYWICWVVPRVRHSIRSLPLRFSIKLGMQLLHQGKHTLPSCLPSQIFFFPENPFSIFIVGFFFCMFWFGFFVWLFFKGEHPTQLNCPTVY